ncbi:MAG: HigA family addiction module antitoxin [Tagaea sp.]
MPEYKVRRPLARPPSHPGALMRDILDEHLRLPVAEAARRMKLSRPALHAVLAGRSAVTAGLALRFARLTGGAPELFVQMQAAHDLWHARRRLESTLDAIRPAA